MCLAEDRLYLLAKCNLDGQTRLKYYLNMTESIPIKSPLAIVTRLLINNNYTEAESIISRLSSRATNSCFVAS